MKSNFKTITAAAVGAVFAATAVHAEDEHSDIEPLTDSALFASTTCIENALRQTFGQESGIDIDMEWGMISTQNQIDGNSVQVEVYLGVKEAVASLNVTGIHGLSTMTENGEVVPAPQGTASLFYYGTEGVPGFSSLKDYDPKSLEKYINTLDKHIRTCAQPEPMVS